KTSSCNSPPSKPKKTPKKKEARSEKHTPHLQERTQELFRVAHRLRRDGALCADLRLAFLRLHTLLRLSQHAGDDAAAAHERERGHHPADAWLRLHHCSVSHSHDHHAAVCRREEIRHHRIAAHLARQG